MQSEEMLRQELHSLNSKFDGMAKSISNIETTLAELRGNALPARVFSLEEKMEKIKIYQAERAWLPEQVDKNTESINSISKTVWRMMGGLAVINVIISIGGKFLADYLLK